MFPILLSKNTRLNKINQTDIFYLVIDFVYRIAVNCQQTAAARLVI
jgi:hypothetical protein